MVSHLGRATLLALVVIVIASALASIPGAQAASPNYTLTGYVYPVGSSLIYSNVQVDLINQATGAVYPTLTDKDAFTFNAANTGGTLGPGYWGLWVPTETNVSTIVSNIGHYPASAVLPVDQNPSFRFYTTSNLTTNPVVPTLYASILSYNTVISGTVELSGNALPGAPVVLLAPDYAGAILYNTTSNFTTGAYTLKAPTGDWVVQARDPNPPGNIGTIPVNVTGSISGVNPNIQSWIVSGQMFNPTGTNPVGTPGNATLFDPANGYLYTTETSGSGRYTLGTYGANFGPGSNTFDLFLSSEGYATVERQFTAPGATSPVTINVDMPLLASSQRGLYDTTLNFTQFNNATGTGNLTVSSFDNLGNNTVYTQLPNGTVAQLWSQIALEFNHAITIQRTSLGPFYAWINSTGPTFPAFQAGTTINGTTFVGPTAAQNFTSEANGCSGTCGPTTGGNLTIGWSNTYALNGTVYKDSSTYAIGFGFRHPVSTSDIYNYTVVLPAGYVLKAGTAAPASTRLTPLGPDGTWSSFNLQSLYSSTPSGTLNFTIVSATTLTAIVNVTVPTYFAFSNQNVLNDTNGNYTVQVGVAQNATFSAANTIYPAGINGTKFTWTFGDGTGTNVTTPSTYHIYTAATASAPDTGTLTVTASNHVVDTTKFHVWVAQGPTTAGILSNASSSQNRTVGGVPYLFINWGTVLYFNSSGSKASITSSTTSVTGVLSVASFTLAAKGFSQSANYSESSGAYFGSNWTVQFLGAGSYLTNGTVHGNLVPFKGWQYNLTLKVWSGTGQTNSTTLVILVNDTEKPVAGFQILNSAGTPVTGKSLVAQANLSAQIQLNGANSSDPHNGSVVRYYWLIGNPGNASVHLGVNVSTVKPYPKLWLAAATQAYWVNLTVYDRNGNAGWSNQTLTVAANSTLTPILSATNLTGPSKVNSGSGSTWWVNVTVGGGSKSTALNVQVTWYTTSPGGTSRSYIGGTPASVTFYNYVSKGVVNSTPLDHGSIASLPYNTTVRAVMSWTPGGTGNYQLYANATASNEFVGDYAPGTNVASMSITVAPNPTTQLLEYIAIGAAVAVAVALIIIFVRRRGAPKKAPAKSTGKSGLERGGKKTADEDEDEDDSA